MTLDGHEHMYMLMHVHVDCCACHVNNKKQQNLSLSLSACCMQYSSQQTDVYGRFVSTPPTHERRRLYEQI